MTEIPPPCFIDESDQNWEPTPKGLPRKPVSMFEATCLNIDHPPEYGESENFGQLLVVLAKSAVLVCYVTIIILWLDFQEHQRWMRAGLQLPPRE